MSHEITANLSTRVDAEWQRYRDLGVDAPTLLTLVDVVALRTALTIARDAANTWEIAASKKAARAEQFATWWAGTKRENDQIKQSLSTDPVDPDALPTLICVNRVPGRLCEKCSADITRGEAYKPVRGTSLYRHIYCPVDADPAAAGAL